MNGALLAGISGLALLDSFNPATIVAVTLILVAAPRRPALVAGAAVLGAALTVFMIGAALFLSAGAVAGAVDGITIALRFLAFGAAGIALIVAGLRRLRERERKMITLPSWFALRTALPFGALLTGVDLPNAFPYFIAIERMTANSVEPATGLLVLAGYAVIYCLPCLVLLVVGLARGSRVRARLQNLLQRLGSGAIRQSVPVAVSLCLVGIGVASVPFWLL